MTSANLLIVLLVGTVVGALTGLGLGSFFANQWYLALVAGFLATIIAGIVRNVFIARGAGLGPDSTRTPTLVLVYSAVASLAGSSAAMEVAQQSQVSAPAWIGTLSG
jgi:tellurite resistance protein TehA-like permease